MRKAAIAWLMVTSVGFGGCTGNAPTPAMDPMTDARVPRPDAGPGPTTDAALDAPRDVPETPTDASPDAAPDAAPDASPDASPDAALDAAPSEGTLVFAMSALYFPPPDPADDSLVQGFDLDGRDNRPVAAGGEGSSDESCNQNDYTSPPPSSETGIDNQLSPVVTAVEELLSDFHLSRRSLARAIVTGRLIVLVRLDDVGSVRADDFVRVELRAGLLPEGVDAPEASTETLDPDQTFDWLSSEVGYAEGTIEDGLLVARDPEGVLSVPLTTGRLVFDLAGGIRMQVDREQLREGVIGVSVDHQYLVETVQDAVPPEFHDFVPNILPADLELGADGRCHRISGAFAFEAVPAQLGEPRSARP